MILQDLKAFGSLLLQGDLADNKGWWQPFLEVLTMYYACKLKTDSDKLKVKAFPDPNLQLDQNAVFSIDYLCGGVIWGSALCRRSLQIIL